MSALAIDWDNTATPQFQASVSLPHVQLSVSQSMVALVPVLAATTLQTLKRVRMGPRPRLNAVLLLIPHPYPGGMSEKALRALQDDALALLPTYAVGVHVGKVTLSAFQSSTELLQVRAADAHAGLGKRASLTRGVLVTCEGVWPA